MLTSFLLTFLFSHFNVANVIRILTHSFPTHPFFTPWKHLKPLRLSDIFRGAGRKGELGKNGLSKVLELCLHQGTEVPNGLTARDGFLGRSWTTWRWRVAWSMLFKKYFTRKFLRLSIIWVLIYVVLNRFLPVHLRKLY